jgi:Ca2+/H+ antiporter
MLITINTVLLLIAAICFLLAGLNKGSQQFNLVAMGLFFWVLTLLLGGLMVAIR